MEELKDNISYKEVELLSEEVQEVMSRIPSAIVRWGMTVMAIIVVGMLIVAVYLPWPESLEVPFEGHRYGYKAVVCISLPSENIRKLLHTGNKQNITLYSPIFSSEYYPNGISGIINDISVVNSTGDGYTTILDIELYNPNNDRDTSSKFSGNILIVISNKTLFQRIYEQISKI